MSCGATGHRLEEAAARFGHALYVYSRAAIEAAYRPMERAFAPVPHRVCYAVKANGSGAILRLLASLGAGADIVSGGELLAARRAGFPPERIVFAGVGKTEAEIALGLEHGIGECNAESEDEIERIGAAAAARGRKARASRSGSTPTSTRGSHPYISTGLRESKFGVDIALVPEILRRARRARRGRGGRGAVPHRLPDHRPRAAGGGGAGAGRPQPAPARRGVRPADDRPRRRPRLRLRRPGGARAGRAGRAVLPALEELPLTLLLEPGRSLVRRSGVLLTRVLYVKENQGKRFVVVDAAMNDLLRPALYDAFHRIEPVVRRGAGRWSGSTWWDRSARPATSSGAGGTSSCPRPATSWPCATWAPTGSRCLPEYNMRPRAAEVLVEEGGARLIRRRETFEDLVATEV